jgi:transcriptional regulator with XRE-family HTH domain
MNSLLRFHRQAERLSRSELARRADLTYETVARLERGRHAPQYRTQRRLADALGVSVDDLFPMPANPPRGSSAAMPHFQAAA